MIFLTLAIKGLAALLCALCARKGRLRGTCALLSIGVLGELLRRLFAFLREGAPKPYTGLSFALWLPDPALVLAVPCVLLGARRGWRIGLVVWLDAFLLVAFAYPQVRGEALLRGYWAVYGTVYLAAVADILWKSRAKRMPVDDALLLALALAGIGEIVMIRLFGDAYWIGILTINAVVYISICAIALLCIKKPVQSAQDK